MAPVGTGADGSGAPASGGEAAGVGTDGCGAVAGIATGVGTTKNGCNAFQMSFLPISRRSDGSRLSRLEMFFGHYEIRAPSSSMPLSSIGFGTDSTMTPITIIRF